MLETMRVPMAEKNNEANFENIRTKLLQEREEILKKMEAFSKKDANESDGRSALFPEFGDKLDENAQEVSEYDAVIGKQEILEKSLNDIDKALDRIKNNTYGVCKYCGRSIGEKRLEACPTAGSCIDCKTKLQETE